jgi:hypothetical protein
MLTNLESVLIVCVILMCLFTLYLVGVFQSKVCGAYLEPIVIKYCGDGTQPNDIAIPGILDRGMS